MTELIFYYAPVTCARVAMAALEEVGAPYEVRLVDLRRHEQSSPGYLAVNPKGKVPALLVDGRLLTETPAILVWLASTFPDAALLPLGDGAFEDALVQSDLNFASSGLHPLVTRLCRPHVFSDAPGGLESVYALAASVMHVNFRLIEERLGREQWWYGDRWSMMDVYLDWIWERVGDTAFDRSPYEHFARHARDLAAWPSVRRANQRGETASAALSAAS